MKAFLFLTTLATTFVTLTAAPAEARPDYAFLGKCLEMVKNVMISTALNPAFRTCAQAMGIGEALARNRILHGTDPLGNIKLALLHEPLCYETWYPLVVTTIQRMPTVNGKVCTLNQPWPRGFSSVSIADFNWRFDYYIEYANMIVHANTKQTGRAVHLRTSSD
ncbi:Aste57867_613 [Aphanomyces stellatus]|uniref:Aste57867_613 protein n=1 Tax=Aphanomyces stellatus TaxID=120398 RepID=A0A485K6A1_9STRA|nr:hypothetical protein As57867_000612 [Aphanomyces stellatus]VFT77838.1 Aste57867_613 [Aphanomyces stellatus]